MQPPSPAAAERAAGRPLMPGDRRRWIGWILFGATLALYAPTLGFDFVSFDDHGYVLDNARMREGLAVENLLWASTTLYMSNWHPATWLSYLLDAELFGLDPAGFHATNALLHGLVVVLVYRVFERAGGRPGPAALAAALMAVHPLHVESVAWVSQRKELLAACFGLLAALAHVRWARQPTALRRTGVVLFGALALAAKPSWVALPFWLLLLDRWPLGRLSLPGEPHFAPSLLLRRVAEKLPLLALAGAASLLTFHAQQGAVSSVALPDRIANAFVACATYLAKTLWPADLSVLYPHPALPGGQPLSAAQIAASVAVVIGLSALAVASARRLPYVAVGWGWFLVGCLPSLGLVQVGWQGMADRYTYAPHIGLFAALAWGLAELRQRLGVGPRTAVAAAAIVLAALALRTLERSRDWRDSVALYRASLEVTPHSALLHHNLGNQLLARGEWAGAAEHFEAALSLRPGWANPSQSLAWLLATAPDPSRRDPQRALELALANARATRFRDANVLDTLAAALAAGGDFEKAEQAAQRALVLARGSGQRGLAEDVSERLALYREGRAYAAPAGGEDAAPDRTERERRGP